MANPTYEANPNDTASETSTAQFNINRSNDLFFPLLALPSAQARRAKVRNVGYGVPSDFELNFGRHPPSFGRADDEGTEAKAS